MITIGIIGCGRIANLAHLPAMEKMEGIRVKYKKHLHYKEEI